MKPCHTKYHTSLDRKISPITSLSVKIKTTATDAYSTGASILEDEIEMCISVKSDVNGWKLLLRD